MKMKKVFCCTLSALLVLGTIVLLVFSLASCGNDDNVLYVCNWGEYISDGSDGSLDVIKEFEKRYGIKVKYDTYTTNEELYALLSSGSCYDVVIPSDYMIARLIEEDLLQKFDPTELENYANIASEYKGLYYDSNDEYSVPYSVGMVGIVYDTTKVSEEEIEEQSWSLLWSQDYKKTELINMDNPRDAFGVAMCYLGLDVNSTDPADWATAFNKLKEQKCIYQMDEIYNKMENGNAVAAAYYAGDCLQMMQENEDLAFYYPKEGTNIFVDAMCIPKKAKHVDAAKEFINFMLDPDVATQNANKICYASPNVAVRTNEDYDYHEGTDEYAILYELPASYQEDPTRMQYYHNLDSATQKLLNDYWVRVKIEN